MSLFALVYRKVPKHIVDLFCLPTGHRASIAAERMVVEVQDVQVEMKKKVEETNTKYKTSANKYWGSKIFEEGNSLMVFLAGSNFFTSTSSTLKPRKYVPYKTFWKINDNAYVINLPDDMWILKTFNVVDLHEFYVDVHI